MDYENRDTVGYNIIILLIMIYSTHEVNMIMVKVKREQRVVMIYLTCKTFKYGCALLLDGGVIK